MSERNEIIDNKKDDMLDIFINEVDKKGTDLLAMSDFFEIFIERIEADMRTYNAWEVFYDIGELSGGISSAIKSGLDLSKVRMLVADSFHFS